MGQETELDFDSICSVDLSPNTVLPLIPRHSSIKKRSTRKKHKHEDFVLNVKDDFTEIRFGGGRRSRKSNLSSLAELEDNEHRVFELNVNDDFTEIRFGRERSSHKSNSRSLVELGDDDVLKRRSKYQSSEDVGNIEGMHIQGGRRKIEISHDNYTSWSSGIVDSLCNSDEENPERISPVLSLDTKLNQSSVNKACIGPRSSDSLIEIYLGSENSETVSKASSNHPENVTGIGPLHNGKKFFKRDKVHALQKSLSAKVEMPKKQFPLESDLRSRHSPKVHISPFRRMLDPFMKSKSVRSRFSHAVEAGEDKSVKTIDLQRNEMCRKSLLQDFSKTSKSSDCDSHSPNNDNHHNAVASSPVHLHGSLKLEKKHGMTFFEFSQSSPEDIYVAKTWKTSNAFKWVYTFHTQDHKKKSNASSFGLNNSCKNSLMVGQMQVSCYLSSELRDGDFDNSMVTEFVLYDTARARQSTVSQGSCDSIHDAVKPPKSPNSGLVGEAFRMNDGTPLEKPKFQQKHASENCDYGSIDSCPWDSADLHPDLESAALVMQIPFSKRESLKYERGDKTSGQLNSAIQNLSKIEQKKEEQPPHHTTQETLKVVIPIGNHGLPTVESHGPSTLLDRWRLGGGCDCGGWDMGCPLLILGSHSSHSAKSQAHKGKQTFELFHQGVNDTTPALTMNVVKDGQYAVDFHARLSTLQAFSICVATLHATEACSAVQMEETKELQNCNSLKVLLEEEVKFLIDAVTVEEKKREMRMLIETPPSYLLNPPFSPIARV